MMARKKQESNEGVTPGVLKFREKRKWQIALRRYVLERKPCFDYAPYFGLDIENMRRWFECQFQPGIGWGDFAAQWQFEHIIPVTYFDFSKEEDLKMCWNFTNIRVGLFQQNKERGGDILAAKLYFKNLYEKTNFTTCQKLLLKIDQIELSETVSTEGQQAFINEHWEYLKRIEHYSAFDYELINSGRDINEVEKEIAFLRKYGE